MATPNFQLYGSGYDSLANQQVGYSRTYDAAAEGNRAAIMAARQFELQQQAQADAQADAYRERDIERGIRLSQYGDVQDYNNRTLESEDYLRRARAKAEGLKFAPSAQDFDNFMQSYDSLPGDANIGQLFPSMNPRDAARAKAVFAFRNTQMDEARAATNINNRNNNTKTLLEIVQSYRQDQPLPQPDEISALSGYPVSQVIPVMKHVAQIRAEQLAREAAASTQKYRQAQVGADLNQSPSGTPLGTNAVSFRMRDRMSGVYDPRIPGIGYDPRTDAFTNAPAQVISGTNRFQMYAPQTSTSTNSLAPNEVVKLLKNGQSAVFDSITKQFIRYAQ